MALGTTREGCSKPKEGVEPVGNFKCEARCCCVAGHIVWVAELKGGIAVFDAQQGHMLDRVVVGDADERVQFKCILLVHDEIWAGSMTGTVHIFDVAARRWKRSLLIHGVEASAPITSLFFDGLSVLGGSETGRVIQWDPFTKQQVTVFVALAPVTAVTVMAGLVVSGDRNGAIQLWDASTCDVIYEHTKDTSGVSSLLHEPTTTTLWVGRRNGTISVYTLSAAMNFTDRLSVGGGTVTSMLAVSGKVFVTTHDRAVVVFAVTTREVVARVTTAHDAFIYAAAKVYTAEMSRVWTIGNDGVIRVWELGGYFLPCQSPPNLNPYEQAATVRRVKDALMVKNAQLSVCVAESSSRVVDVKEELRRVRNEAQELRLRLDSCEHRLKEKDAEIAMRISRINELEDDVKRLQKDVIDTNARADAAQRESSFLRKDYQTALLDVSKARAETTAKIAEKANVEQQLSAQRAERSHLEIRIRDKDAEVTQLKAENAQLNNSLRQLSSLQGVEKNVTQKIFAKDENVINQELDELRKRNQLLGGLLSSMEYTIRRKEEEERDMTALLNACRRKVAEHVTDPHLAALLQLTMMRNPTRFDVEADEYTKALLRDGNGPFIEFLQLIRNRDAHAYEQLVEYLQHPKAGSKRSVFLDQLLTIAKKKDGVSNEDIVTFKKSLPVLLDSMNRLNDTSPLAESGGVLANGKQGSVSKIPPVAAGLLTATDSNRGVGALSNTRLEDGVSEVLPTTNSKSNSYIHMHNGSGDGGDSKTLADAPLQISQQQTNLGTFQSGSTPPITEDEFKNFVRNMGITGNYLGVVGQTPLGFGDESYLKQLYGTFEFIIQTRRDLVEQLALLLKRIVKAHQVVDALTSNARESLSSTSRRLSGGNGNNNGRHLGLIVTNILDELHRFVSDVVTTYFTGAEKQRLGFGV